MKRLGLLTVLAALTVVAVVAPIYAGGDALVIQLIRNTAFGQQPRFDLISSEEYIQNFDNIVGLSNEQKAKMKEVLEARYKALEEYQADKDGKVEAAWAALYVARMSGDANAIDEATVASAALLAPVLKMEKKTQDDTMNVLTPEQRTKMEKVRAGKVSGLSLRWRIALGVTDDKEWMVMEPLIEKVESLRVQAGLPDNGYVGNRALWESESMKAFYALQKVLHNKDATNDEIGAALETLREARTQAKVELERAQKDLRNVLTARQEAVAVKGELLD